MRSGLAHLASATRPSVAGLSVVHRAVLARRVVTEIHHAIVGLGAPRFCL